MSSHPISAAKLHAAARASASSETSDLGHARFSSYASQAPKFAKIQPAIAIKPKPSSASAPLKSTFNPRYDPSTSAHSSLLQDDRSANINTSRKWVLPPRPRPGRKPSSVSGGLDEPRRCLSHKKHKSSRCSDADTSDDTASSPPFVSSPIASTSKRTSSASNMSKVSSEVLCSASSPASSDISVAPENFPPEKCSISSKTPACASEPSSQVAELQKIYLARLKEQELVQNYIEILTNQIKELKFVQSGVITFDALDTHSASKPITPVSSAPDQLDHINNVRDLDLFLNHLTKQSNVIHSVTKKYLGDSSRDGRHLQSQIRHFLELRARHIKAKNCYPNAADKGLDHASSPLSAKPADSISHQPTVSATTAFPQPVEAKPIAPGIAQAMTSSSSTSSSSTSSSQSTMKNMGKSTNAHKPSSFFTPSFLRPLNMNLFEEDSSGSVDIINERDMFSDVASWEKKRPDLAPEIDIDGAFSSDLKMQSLKGQKKLGCGFCSGETPCLCFDAESIWGEK